MSTDASTPSPVNHDRLWGGRRLGGDRYPPEPCIPTVPPRLTSPAAGTSEPSAPPAPLRSVPRAYRVGSTPHGPQEPRTLRRCLAVQRSLTFPARACARTREATVIATSASLSALQSSAGACA